MKAIKKIVGILLHGVWYLWLVNLNFWAVIVVIMFFDTVFPPNDTFNHFPKRFAYYMVSFVLMVVYSDSMLIENKRSKFPRPHPKQLLVFYTVVLIPLISYLVVRGILTPEYIQVHSIGGEDSALPLFIGGILYLGLVTYVKEKLKTKEKQAHALATAAKEETDE